MENYDIVIVGSGIVGLIFANIMAQNPELKIAIVSGDDPGARQDIGRVCALNHASLQALRKLQLSSSSYSYYDKVFVWKEGSDLGFNASEFGYKHLGAIVNNVALESELWHQVKENVTTFCNAAAESVNVNKCYELTLAGGQKLKAKLLVGADGADSWVRRNLDISITSELYEQNAIVATIKSAKSHDNTAWQKFVKTGTIALLPLQDDKTLSLVWSCCAYAYQDIMDLGDKEFAEVLSREIDHKLGDIEIITKRISFPLRSVHAHTYIGTNAAVIGDAAHVVHPLAGQGVNYGILDAVVLSGKLLAVTDIDNVQDALIGYAKARRGQNGFDIAMLSHLKKLFIANYPVVSGFLSLGMNMLNSSKAAKKQLLAKALGL